MGNNLASSPHASRLNNLFSPDAKDPPLEHDFTAQNLSQSVFLTHVISCRRKQHQFCRAVPRFKCRACLPAGGPARLGPFEMAHYESELSQQGAASLAALLTVAYTTHRI